MPTHPFRGDRVYLGEARYLYKAINLLWYFRRHSLAMSSQEGISFQEALMIIITCLIGPKRFEPDPAKAWNEHVKDDPVTCSLYAAALLLVEGNYRVVNTLCIRYQLFNPFFTLDQSIILGCEDFLTSTNHWFGSMTGDFAPEAAVQGCITMLKTLRERHSHPELDGTLFHVPEMFLDEEELFKGNLAVMGALKSGDETEEDNSDSEEDDDRMP